MTGRDLSTAEGLTAYRSLTPTTPPAVRALSVSVTVRLAVEPGHHLFGREIDEVTWTRASWDDFTPRAILHYAAGGCVPVRDTPDPLPSWVTPPELMWFAITDELAGEVLP